jgi:CDP-4-dehydro-6-deoxyglucose reductase, E3
MTFIALTSGPHFETQPGSSILGAAAQARVALPYSCRTGRCSTCRCRVLSGTTTALYPETGLSDLEKSEGWILSCVRSAETDVVLEVDEFARDDMPVVRTLPCRIGQIQRLAENVVRIQLRLPPATEFAFIPGQYIEVIGPNGIRRSYSLANPSFADKVLELHIRAVAGGAMSHYWFNQAKVNDLLRLSGPLGTFFLREPSGMDVIFLATGTGIAPVKAILESLVSLPRERCPSSVTALWGGRYAQDFYLDVAGMACNHIVIPVRSRPDEAWSGAKGYVQDVLLGMRSNFGNAVVYACGSTEMILSAKTRLIDAGLQPKRFYSDAFVRSGSH